MVPEIWSKTDNFLSFWTIFCPFTPYAPRKPDFWKNERCMWRYCNCTNVYHKWVTWCMVPEIWNATDRISCHFGQFFAFLPPPNNPKNQNFEKLKKRPGGIIILHTCTINDNHMMYSSWDMKYDRQNFLSLWTVFLPFYYPNNPKNQNFEKKWNKSLQILSFYTCTINGNHITYCSWDMKHDGQNFLSFWTVFCHFTSVNPKNQNFEKLKKRPEDIIILHMHAAINENQMYCSWNVEHDRLFCHFGPFFALLSHPTPKI